MKGHNRGTLDKSLVSRDTEALVYINKNIYNDITKTHVKHISIPSNEGVFLIQILDRCGYHFALNRGFGNTKKIKLRDKW